MTFEVLHHLSEEMMTYRAHQSCFGIPELQTSAPSTLVFKPVVFCLNATTIWWVINRRWLLSLRCNDFATIIGCHPNPDAVWHATRPNWSFDQQNSGSTHSKYGFWGFVMSGLLVFNSAAFRVRWSHVNASRWVGGLAAGMGFFRGGKI